MPGGCAVDAQGFDPVVHLLHAFFVLPCTHGKLPVADVDTGVPGAGLDNAFASQLLHLHELGFDLNIYVNHIHFAPPECCFGA